MWIRVMALLSVEHERLRVGVRVCVSVFVSCTWALTLCDMLSAECCTVDFIRRPCVCVCEGGGVLSCLAGVHLPFVFLGCDAETYIHAVKTVWVASSASDYCVLLGHARLCLPSDTYYLQLQAVSHCVVSCCPLPHCFDTHTHTHTHSGQTIARPHTMK